MIFNCKKCKRSFEADYKKFFCPECEEESVQKIAQMMEKEIYCQCYQDGQKPALLTDWRYTNICQSCGKPKI